MVGEERIEDGASNGSRLCFSILYSQSTILSFRESVRADMSPFDPHRFQVAGEHAINQIGGEMIRHVVIVKRAIEAGDPVGDR